MTIQYETLPMLDLSAIITNCEPSFNVTVSDAHFYRGELILEAYEIDSYDSISITQAAELDYSDPVICEREDVENAIPKKEYETLKQSDTRRFNENQELITKVIELVKDNKELTEKYEYLKKPWYRRWFSKKTNFKLTAS